MHTDDSVLFTILKIGGGTGTDNDNFQEDLAKGSQIAG